MRRIALVTAVLVFPLVVAAPAYAVDNVICVGSPTGVTCNDTGTTIIEAITKADLSPVADTIVVGPGVYTEALPLVLDGSTHAVTLKGSGQGSTIITLPASATSQDYVVAHDSAIVRDLTVQLAAANSSNDTALKLYGGASADHVTIDGTGTGNATGVEVQSATVSASDVEMPLSDPNSTGFFSTGSAAVTDTTIAGTIGFDHSGQNTTDTLSRVHIDARYRGISTDGGDVDVDDAVIDLGTAAGAIALAAVNTNNSTYSKAINANHVTIVGGGTNSIGVYAWAANVSVVQQSTIQLDNSIVRGPVKDLWAEAENGGTATITSSYSDWATTKVVENSGATGNASVSVGSGNLDNVDPSFVNAGAHDYHLTATSPLIDRGAPGTGAPTFDLDGGARVLDGDGDGTARRDMGAYEAPAKAVPVVPDTTAPGTSITSHPRKRVTKPRVRFGFTASEAGSTFQCKLDKKAWRACTSPKRYKVTIGRHRFQVRAIDAAGNLDATSAIFRFRRVG